MRYPYERFARYLLSRKLDVNAALDKMGLPRVGDLWVLETMKQLRREAPPAVLHYLSARHEEPVFHDGFLAWAEQVEIRIFWDNEPAFRAGPPDAALTIARSLFLRRLTRSVLGMGLLSQLGEDDLLQVMKDRFRLEIPTAALSLYATLFWDHRRTTSAFWEDVLPAFGPDERQAYALGLRWPPPDIHELRELLGLKARLEADTVLYEIMGIARNYYQAELRRPTPDDRVVLQWMARAQSAAEKVHKNSRLAPKTGEAAEDPAQRFNLFSVRVEEAVIPTLAELEGEVSERDEGRERS